jgi:hypothetical protein
MRFNYWAYMVHNRSNTPKRSLEPHRANAEEYEISIFLSINALFLIVGLLWTEY